MSDLSYYEGNPDQWGNYQYATLSDIVESFIMSQVDGSYVLNVPRHQVLFQARRAFRELYFDTTKEIKAIELDLNPALTVTLPPDFVNYVRVSWVGQNGELYPMAENRDMNIADEYLQDNEYNLLFDNDGCVLQGDSNWQMEQVNDNPINQETEGQDWYSRYTLNNYAPNKNHSNQYPNGQFKLNRRTGTLRFSSEVASNRIVIEYISDGLWTGCEGLPESNLRIHKFCETAVRNFIYNELIQMRSDVPDYEKRRADKRWWNYRRLAKRRMSTLRYDNLLQIFKGSNKMIKGV